MLAALRAVREELSDAGQAKVKELIQVGKASAQYDDNMQNFGVTEDSFNSYKDSFLKAQENIKEGEIADITKLPSIYGGYGDAGNVYNNPLEYGFELPGSGQDNTQSMESWLQKKIGAGGE